MCASPRTIKATTKLRCAAKCDVTQTANKKGYSNGGQHAFLAFSCYPPRYDWSYRGPDASGGEEHADAGSRAIADGKDPLTKDRQQGEDAAAETPRGFDQQ